MAQDYKILDVKKGNEWSSDFGTFQSYAMALEGIGEPVQLNKKVPVNQEPTKGDTLYGTLEKKTNRNGNEYYRFKAEKKQEGGGHHKSPEQEEAIARAVALKAAVDIVAAHGSLDKDPEQEPVGYSLAVADRYLSWLKNEKPATEPQNGSQEQKEDVVHFPEENEEISLDNIPF